MKELTRFIEKENRLRTSEYMKNIEDERFLSELNDLLSGYDYWIRNPDSNQIPNVYVYGLPRSGTTLVCQAVVNSLDCVWPTNLMARFWEAPVVGIKLSRMLGLYDADVSYKSAFGVTKGVQEPHEFGYFWMKWMNYPDVTIRDEFHAETIDWRGMEEILRAMRNEAHKPVVFKNILYALHLEKFAQMDSKSLFIYCKRDLADVAVSIYNTRKKRYGDAKHWWSYKTPDFCQIVKKSPVEQIIHQVRTGHELLESWLEKPELRNRIYTVNYDRVNQDMPSILMALQNKHGLEIKTKLEWDFSPVTHKGKELYRQFECLNRGE